MAKALLIIAAILILILGGYYAYTQFTYSEGNRAGVLIKFSKKGNMFKTYEGQINQIGLNQTGAGDNQGAMGNNLWNFSVKDQPTADSLSTMEGKNINVHYREIKKAFPWQGETNFFVDRVEVVK